MEKKYYHLEAVCHAPEEYQECGLLCKFCYYCTWKIQEKDGECPPNYIGSPKDFETRKEAQQAKSELEQEFQAMRQRKIIQFPVK